MFCYHTLVRFAIQASLLHRILYIRVLFDHRVVVLVVVEDLMLLRVLDEARHLGGRPGEVETIEELDRKCRTADTWAASGGLNHRFV